MSNNFTSILHKTILSIGLIGVFASCSVAMAAKKDGTSVDKVQNCHSRSQFLSCGPTIVSSYRSFTGELVETYQYQNERGSAARALMHGVLDISTCGLWEVVGTPIEACAGEKTYFCIKVYYDANEVAKKVELM